MNKKTMEYLVMYRNVQRVLNENQSIVASTPGLQSAVTRLTEKLDLLEASFQNQAVMTHGVRNEKDLHFAELRSLAMQLKKALFLVGQINQNGIMMFRHRQSNTVIKGLSPIKLQSLCMEMLADITSFEADLTGFGIDAAMIQRFQELLTSAEKMYDSTRLAIVKRVAETKKIEQLMKELKLMLRTEIDQYALFLRDKQSEFYNTYKAARRVVGQRGKKIDRDESPTNLLS